MKLIDTATNAPRSKGDAVRTFCGEHGTLVDFREPHKPGSSGFVYVQLEGGQGFVNEWYPSVIGAKFVED